MTHGVHWGGEVISTVEATRWGLKLEDGTAYITVIQDGGLLTSPRDGHTHRVDCHRADGVNRACGFHRRL